MDNKQLLGILDQFSKAKDQQLGNLYERFNQQLQSELSSQKEDKSLKEFAEYVFVRLARGSTVSRINAQNR